MTGCTFPAHGARTLSALAVLALLAGGCACPPPHQGPRAAQPARFVEWAAQPQRATPIFTPARPAAGPDGAGQWAAGLPPLELFAYRRAWPAAGAVPLGEVTFYRERYYDRQGSWTDGRAHVNNYVHRTFESYRTGVLAR